MKSLQFAAYVCISLAVLVAGVGLAATAQLIKEYGNNVSPLVLAAQAAALWAPLAGMLAAVGLWLRRKSRHVLKTTAPDDGELPERDHKAPP